MDISIDDRWSGYVQETLGSGRFTSASDLVDAALKLMQEQDAKHAELRTLIAEGMDESGDMGGPELDAFFATLGDDPDHASN